MVAEYEIRVRGPVGPAVASMFPELRATVVPDSVVIAGVAATADDLIRAMQLLGERGLAPLDAVVTRP
jgi:hypothetical protein